MQRCQATTQKGVQCRRTSIAGTTACTQHGGESCPVCLASMSQGTFRRLDCGHTFHTRCLERWKRTSTTCPMCRTPFDQPQYRVSISVQHLASNVMTRDSYVTSNISQIMSTFGIPPLQPRFITDIFFDIGFDEFIDDVFREIGVRIPSVLGRDFRAAENGQTQSDQPPP
jgi:Ring finger domain